MEFKEVEGSWYMAPTSDESYVLSILSLGLDRHHGIIPIEELHYTKGIFEELSYTSDYDINSIRESKDMSRLAEYIFDHLSRKTVCDTALKDIGKFLLDHPEYEVAEPKRHLTLVDNKE